MALLIFAATLLAAVLVRQRFAALENFDRELARLRRAQFEEEFRLLGQFNVSNAELTQIRDQAARRKAPAGFAEL